MLCRATVQRFYNGTLVGPSTGNETVDYTGPKKERPKDFIIITDKIIAAEKIAAEKLAAEQKEQSSGLPFDMTDTSLPASGGGEPKKTTSTVGRVDSVNESADVGLSKKVEMDDKGAVIGPDTEIES